MEHTIRVHGASVRRADAEHGCHHDILEGRHEEKGGILIIDGLELFVIDRWLGIPNGGRQSTCWLSACRDSLTSSAPEPRRRRKFARRN